MRDSFFSLHVLKWPGKPQIWKIVWLQSSWLVLAVFEKECTIQSTRVHFPCALAALAFALDLAGRILSLKKMAKVANSRTYTAVLLKQQSTIKNEGVRISFPQSKWIMILLGVHSKKVLSFEENGHPKIGVASIIYIKCISIGGDPVNSSNLSQSRHQGPENYHFRRKSVWSCHWTYLNQSLNHFVSPSHHNFGLPWECLWVWAHPPHCHHPQLRLALRPVGQWQGVERCGRQSDIGSRPSPERGEQMSGDLHM